MFRSGRTEPAFPRIGRFYFAPISPGKNEIGPYPFFQDGGLCDFGAPSFTAPPTGSVLWRKGKIQCMETSGFGANRADFRKGRDTSLRKHRDMITSDVHVFRYMLAVFLSVSYNSRQLVRHYAYRL